MKDCCIYRIWVVLVCVLLLCGCVNRGDGNKMTPAITEQPVSKTIVLKYDEPLNGYDVSLRCKQVYADIPCLFYITISLKRDGKEINEHITDVISFERLFNEEKCLEILGNDTTVIHNTHQELDNPFFDCHNIVYFEDIDFDGKDEFIVCTHPVEHISSDIMDCESYLAFEVYSYFLHQNDNRYTRRIAGDLCRTEYSVDRSNKTVSFTGYLNAYESLKEMYWFDNGQPYKLDYSIVDGEERTEYHFLIDRIDAVIDSVILSKYNIIGE